MMFYVVGQVCNLFPASVVNEEFSYLCGFPLLKTVHFIVYCQKNSLTVQNKQIPFAL